MIEIPGYVGYEMIRFVEQTERAFFPDAYLQQPQNESVKDACLEAALVHARLLLTFFQCKSDKDHPDDVFSASYGFGPRQLGISKDYCKKLNQDLAHMSAARTKRSIEDKKWGVDFFLPFVEMISAFSEHVIIKSKLPDDQLSIWRKTNSIARSLSDRLRGATSHGATGPAGPAVTSTAVAGATGPIGSIIAESKNPS